jgi:Tfp pilus assembly protein PilO
MKSIQMTPKLSATVAMVFALVLLLGVAIWSFAVPAPTPVEVDAKFAAQKSQQRANLVHADERLEELEASNAALLATGEAEQIGSSLLALVTQKTDALGLKLQAFRPQRLEEVRGMQMLPYTLSVEGSYLQALRLLKELETGGQKLSVQLVQVASSDDQSDSVAATFGIAVFVKNEEVKG